MVMLPPPQINAPGGILELEFQNINADERRRWTVHLCPFDPVTLAYTSPANKVPTVDAVVHDTYIRLVGVLGPYLTSDWLIVPVCLWYNAGSGQYVTLLVPPLFDPQPGSAPAPPLFGPTVRRIIDVPGQVGRGRRFWFSQIFGDSFDGSIPLNTSGGGIDSRDVALITNLSSLGSGTCAPNGYNFAIEGTVRQRIHRPLEAQAAETYVIRWNDTTCAIEQSTDNGATWAAISGWDIAGLADCLEVHLPPAPIVRWNTSDCSLEVSLDNGATYSAIPGWDLAAVQGCVMGSLQIRITGGTLQWSTDGGSTWTDGGTIPPPNPQGVSTDQQACNIAAWLAANILQGSLASMSSSITAARNLIDSAEALILAIPVLGEIDALTTTAATVLFNVGTTVGASALSSAASDPVLQDDLQCAIYSAIKADGYVTNSNFSAIMTNINAISYGTPGIIGLINDYLVGLGPLPGLGAAGLEGIQARGSLYVGDCSSCPTGMVAIYDGTDDFLEATGLMLHADETDSWTIIMWIKQDPSGVTGIGYLYDEGDSSISQGLMQIGWWFDGVKAQSFDLWWWRGSPTFAWSENNSDNPWAAGTWHMVAFQSSGADSMALWVDGAYRGFTRNYPVPVSVANQEGKTFLGKIRYVGTDSGFYKGKMTDVRIYMSMLSSTDLSTIYAGTAEGLVALGSPKHWWKMNEGSGGSVADHGSSPTALTWNGSGAHWASYP